MIRVILFDLDNTLMDFRAAAEIALDRAFRAHGLVWDPAWYDLFDRVSAKYWQAHERGEISHEAIYRLRFPEILQELGLEGDGAALDQTFIGEVFEQVTPIDGAEDCLRALQGKVRLCIASNAPAGQQVSRLKRARWEAYFEQVFESGALGVSKPEPSFFAACLAALPGIEPEEVLMVGDSLTADMAGAHAFGMKTCWYAPGAEEVPDWVDHHVRHLSDVATWVEMK